MPQLIAHYTSVRTVFDHIIPNQRLKATLLNSTNDPYEARFHLHAGRWAMSGSEADSFAILDGNNARREAIEKRTRLICFGEADDVGIDCANIHPLWAYYASAKDGVDAGCAVIFDKELLLQKIASDAAVDLDWAGRINYVPPQTIVGLHPGAIHVGRIFSIKSDAWKEEREYRVILKLRTDSTSFHLLDVSGCIHGMALSTAELDNITPSMLSAFDASCGRQVKLYRRFYNTTRHTCQVLPVNRT